ncbi:DUF1289 domain-containing protein [Aquabacter sp. L1I39]|uniref:DUF1289 domain-containing protein n=1 Tax=Aquabacter sp. L1I39 TaxID=2820278 RepID=UPI001AD9FD28|nr:DUF1289 domain-containing protein [Aquabacter sp. L1I39]QTL02438.1 DUF1289 domain-containing protein [Aquabacter sp. L1I39]
MTGTAMETPCIKVCVVDPASGLCIGCGRTLQEIGAWAGLSPQRRKAVMAALPGRLEWLRRERPAAFED